MLLRHALGGDNRTTIIATVNPLERHMAETLATLDFAQRAKSVKNSIVRASTKVIEMPVPATVADPAAPEANDDDDENVRVQDLADVWASPPLKSCTQRGVTADAQREEEDAAAVANGTPNTALSAALEPLTANEIAYLLADTPGVSEKGIADALADLFGGASLDELLKKSNELDLLRRFNAVDDTIIQKHRAATRLQSVALGFIARKRVCRKVAAVLQDVAAVRLQAAVRSLLVRIRLDFMHADNPCGTLLHVVDRHKWYNAKVIDSKLLSGGTSMLKIHYVGWKSEFAAPPLLTCSAMADVCVPMLWTQILGTNGSTCSI
jgi:hypothetical protein